jgi:hypothetical protein
LRQMTPAPDACAFHLRKSIADLWQK